MTAAARTLSHVTEVTATGETLRVRSDSGGRHISELIELVEGGGRQVKNISLKEPSLETLFISLTGRKLD